MRSVSGLELPEPLPMNRAAGGPVRSTFPPHPPQEVSGNPLLSWSAKAPRPGTVAVGFMIAMRVQNWRSRTADETSERGTSWPQRVGIERCALCSSASDVSSLAATGDRSRSGSREHCAIFKSGSPTSKPAGVWLCPGEFGNSRRSVTRRFSQILIDLDLRAALSTLPSDGEMDER